jgi:phage tail sheath protein FI
MTTTFLHGAQVLNGGTSANPVTTVATSIIGIIGTAPNADPTVFPLNTPVLIPGSAQIAASLDTTVTDLTSGAGTLPDAVDSILKQAGAVIVVVRVDGGTAAMPDTAQQILANVLGGVNASTGQYLGLQAFLASQSILGFTPRILIAPGFTHQRVAGGVIAINVSAGGEGYTNGTYTLVATGGTGGSGVVATATVANGAVVSTAIQNSGGAYTAAPSFALPASAGTGTGAVFAATIGTAGNAVVSDLIPVAQRIRAVIIQDGPNTNNTDAITAAGDFVNGRVYMVDPQFVKTNGSGDLITSYSSAAVAGLIAQNDNANGWWWSPSNQQLNGVQATARAIDFKLGDPSSAANLLNESNVATIVRQQGYRLWGNRATDGTFLCVTRVNDIINDSLQEAILWAVDRGITKNYVTEVIEYVNADLRDLTTEGAILGGTCWADANLNSDSNIQAGKIYFDFKWTPVYPAEDITFTSYIVDDYIQTVFAGLTAPN